MTGFMVLDKEFLGGRYAFGADLPIIYTSLSGKIVLEPETTAFDEDGVKIGDPGIIPISLLRPAEAMTGLRLTPI